MRRRLRRALSDRKLRAAVLRSCARSVQARDQVVAELEDFEGARQRAGAVRQQALDRLDRLLDQFSERFTAAGGHLHNAADGAAARSIVLEILDRHGVRQGVKSKSMVCEEVGLGRALREAGIEAVETDLGEFIVQLFGEPPSHITAPALHRSRGEIGELFQRRLGVPYVDDPAGLTGIARRHLRGRFLAAEFGISGANFLIAETGHLAIVENEGNARLGMSLPPLYIALSGVEKVVARLEDLGTLLALLPRSATGQRTTAYFHLLRPATAGEDGAGEMHLVLVDNGRRRALADPVMREMMLCIRCGACLNICPVYQSVGGHAYGAVYPGPMGAVLSCLVGEDVAKHRELPHLSTLCGACRDVCPVGIDIPRLLLELRARAPKDSLERAAAKGWEWAMSSPRRLETAGRLAGLAGTLLPGGWGLKPGAVSFRRRARAELRGERRDE